MNHPCVVTLERDSAPRTLFSGDQLILVLALLGVIPRWSHSRSWGYAPSGAIGLLVVVIIVLLLTGRI
jgi:hypothetical protein